MGCGSSQSIDEKKEDINVYNKQNKNNIKEKELFLNIGLNTKKLNNLNDNGNNSKLIQKKEEKEKEDKDISLKNQQTKEENKEKEISQKKIKSYSFLTISQNVLDYLPEDISKDEIKLIVYDALRNSIINDKDKYIKGKNLTVEQANCLMDILYNIVANIDNNKEEEKYKRLLGDIKIKIEVLEINKENARKILFKDLEPTEEEIEETLGQFANSNDIPNYLLLNYHKIFFSLSEKIYIFYLTHHKNHLFILIYNKNKYFFFFFKI